MSSETALASLLAAVQYADSAYPAGGFAQSWGLETAVACGAVRDRDSLAAACRDLLRQQAGPADAVAAAACCRPVADLALLHAIDRRLNATKPAREARLGSQRMGRRLIETAAAVEGDAALLALRDAIVAGKTPGHHAVVFGAVCDSAGLQAASAAALLLWTLLNGLLGAALRLLPLTHEDVQHLLVESRPLIAELATEAATADPLRLAGSAPLFDLWSMQHETAAVRLFAS